MMNIFVERMNLALDGRPCFLVMDQVGWHSSKDLKMPPNIKPVYLPALARAQPCGASLGLAEAQHNTQPVFSDA